MTTRTQSSPNGSWARLGAPSIPLVMLALLPKCPICLGAYLGVFAWLGWSTRTVAGALTGLLVLAGSVLLARWAWAAWRLGCRIPLALGLAGFATVVAARCLEGPPQATWLGAFLFGCGSLASARIPGSGRSCCGSDTAVNCDAPVVPDLPRSPISSEDTHPKLPAS